MCVRGSPKVVTGRVISPRIEFNGCVGEAAPSFGSALRVLRGRAGLTQERLAERAGLSPNAISSLERGARRRPYPSTIRALAEALGLSRDERAALERSALGRTPARQPEPASAAVPRQLPLVTRNFTGRRADLARLDALLTSGPESGSTVVISAIAGTAGVGKTTLALVWAHRVKDLFPDGQLYVNLRGYDPGPPAEPGEVLESFLRALDVPPASIPPDQVARAALFRSIVDGRRLLLVLDNAGSTEQVRPLLPGSPGSLVLVTSRARLDGLAVSVGAVCLTLDVLPVPDAVALLRSLIGPARADAESRALATLALSCGRLPLALRLAGQRAASRPHLRLADLVDELAVDTRRLDLLSAGEDDYTAVRSVFSWSYRGLPDAQARMLRRLGLHTGPDISAHAAAALADVPLARARGLLDGLAEAHLVEYVRRDRWRLHDLLRDYACEQAMVGEPGPERLAAVRRLAGFYTHTAAAANQLLHPGRRATPAGGVPPPREPAPVRRYEEALAWCESERANLVAVTRSAAEHGLAEAAWQLPNSLWSFYYTRKYWADWETVCTIGLRAARSRGDLDGQSVMLSALSTVHRDLHRFDDAVDHLRESLELNRRLGDRFGEARMLSNLGDVYLGMRRYDDALDQSLRALLILREIGDTYTEGVALGNVSEAYLGLHRYGDALHSFQQVLELCRRIDHRYGEGLTLLHLGEAHLGLRRYAAAIDHLTRAARLCRDVGNAQGEGMAWKTLGEVHRAAGRPGQARRCWQTARKILSGVGGPEADEIRAKLAAPD